MGKNKLTKEKLEKLLTRKLGLAAPEFHLEKAGVRLVGNIISQSFKGKPDHKRQELIWNALESEFGAESVRLVGMLLAFTPDEWNLSDDILSAVKKNRKAG
jgi:acid stress-induced BolA-like protein IbaG/YrbA